MKPQNIKPVNHFGLFIYEFCERTNQSLISISEATGFQKHQLKLYIETHQKPTVKNMILLSNQLSIVAKTSKYRMFMRLYDALEKDLKQEPFPPEKRIKC